MYDLALATAAPSDWWAPPAPATQDALGTVANPPVASTSPSPHQRHRVLHVINGEHYSGAERVQDLLALQLPQFGYAVELVALKEGKFAAARQGTRVPLHQLAMRGRCDLRVVGKLVELAKDRRAELLHAHTPRTALVTAIAARRLGLPWVYHVHSPVSRDSRRMVQNSINSWVEWWSLRSAARAIVVSPTLLPYMQQRGLPAARLTCVPNGVPVCPEPRPATPPHGEWTIGMVALFRPRKGTEILLEAIACLASRGRGVRLRAIGGFETPEYEGHIRQLVDQLGLQQVVDFTGFTTDVAGELTRLDLMVLPSLFGEGLPMVVLEAMAAGVPTIVSNVEGASSAIEQGITGLLVPPGSAAELAAAIEAFLTGEIDYPAMANAARQRHAAHFSDVAMARGVAGVYDELVGAAAIP